MDRIDQLGVFTRVAEMRSFTRAAATLGLPRSTVSTAVQQLEKRVGARLLARNTRNVALTQDGEMFYERCLQLLADMDETEGMFQQRSATLSGRVVVDMPGRIGRLVVAPELADFLAEYPGLAVDLGVRDRAVDLVAERVDCAVRVGVLDESELVARPIGLLQLINVASPAYLREYGRPHSPAELVDHLAVRYASPTTGRVEPWEWCDQGKVHVMHVPGRVTVNNAEAQIACCLAGLGLIQIPAYDVSAHLENGELVEVLPSCRPEPLPMTLLYPHRQQLSQRLRVFADWLAPLLRDRCCVG